MGNAIAPTVSVNADWLECVNAEVEAGMLGRTADVDATVGRTGDG